MSHMAHVVVSTNTYTIIAHYIVRVYFPFRDCPGGHNITIMSPFRFQRGIFVAHEIPLTPPNEGKQPKNLILEEFIHLVVCFLLIYIYIY